jgi:hypothetical protein
MVAIIKPPLSLSQERERATWQYRTIARCRGNQTLLGCILIAIHGRAPSNAPRIVGAANIDGDGVLLAPFQSNNRDQAEIVPICRVAELVEQLKRLADDLQLSDDETKSMFAEARKWINDDARARTPVEKANLTEI